MSFGRVALAWMGVSVWLLLMNRASLRFARSEFDRARAGGPLHVTLVEAALVTLLGSLWFASLGSGGWWLVFGLLALVVDVPLRLREGVKSRKSKAEEVQSQKSKADGVERDASGTGAPDFRLSTFDPIFDPRGAILVMLRFLGSGLILSLVL